MNRTLINRAIWAALAGWAAGHPAFASPSTPAAPPGTGYVNPILAHNGKLERSTGYCSDVFADAAIRFLDADPSRPFFAYLAFNAPHEPLQVLDADLKPYREAGPAPGLMPGE